MLSKIFFRRLPASASLDREEHQKLVRSRNIKPKRKCQASKEKDGIEAMRRRWRTLFEDRHPLPLGERNPKPLSSSHSPSFIHIPPNVSVQNFSTPNRLKHATDQPTTTQRSPPTNITNHSNPEPKNPSKMCKSLIHQYTCSHITLFRLSTCSGTFSFLPTRPSNAPLAICSALAEIVIHSEQECGMCQYSHALAALEGSHAEGSQGRWDDEDAWKDAGEEMEEREGCKMEKGELKRRFPDGSSKVFAVPNWEGAWKRGLQRGLEGKRRGSPLRNEVQVEDLDVDVEM